MTRSSLSKYAVGPDRTVSPVGLAPEVLRDLWGLQVQLAKLAHEAGRVNAVRRVQQGQQAQAALPANVGRQARPASGGQRVLPDRTHRRLTRRRLLR